MRRRQYSTFFENCQRLSAGLSGKPSLDSHYDGKEPSAKGASSTVPALVEPVYKPGNPRPARAWEKFSGDSAPIHQAYPSQQGAGTLGNEAVIGNRPPAIFVAMTEAMDGYSPVANQIGRQLAGMGLPVAGGFDQEVAIPQPRAHAVAPGGYPKSTTKTSCLNDEGI